MCFQDFFDYSVLILALFYMYKFKNSLTAVLDLLFFNKFPYPVSVRYPHSQGSFIMRLQLHLFFTPNCVSGSRVPVGFIPYYSVPGTPRHEFY